MQYLDKSLNGCAIHVQAVDAATLLAIERVRNNAAPSEPASRFDHSVSDLTLEASAAATLFPPEQWIPGPPATLRDTDGMRPFAILRTNE